MSAVQLVLHEAAPHTYGLQAVLVPFTQVPEPLHDCPVCSPALQLVVPQAVPKAHLAQVPEPSQFPFNPQLVLGSAAQSLSGSVAAAALPQVPLEPLPFLAVLQAWQLPEQVVSQQKPSTQLPLWHCELAVQLAPRPWSARHVLSELRHHEELRQSRSLEQLALQPPVPQR